MAGARHLAQADADSGLTGVLHLNVGGWVFSIPRETLARFPECELWRRVCAFPHTRTLKLFLDWDGFIFRNVHRHLLTRQLPGSSESDVELLYEQAGWLRLRPVTEALDRVKEGNGDGRTQPDVPPAHRAPLDQYKSYKSRRLSEAPIRASLLHSELEDKAPFRLLDNPLINSEDALHYCFLPTRVLDTYPAAISDDDLLWFSETFILTRCGCEEFRFIGNFLLSGKFLLPEEYVMSDALEEEVRSLGIPALLQALRGDPSLGSPGGGHGATVSNHVTGQGCQPGRRPFYVMALELLAKYPDSALGQLSIDSSVDGCKLHISGSGSLFRHIQNWFGSCTLPLTSSAVEISGLCSYLDRGDPIHQPAREAMRSYLRRREHPGPETLCNIWTADVQEVSRQQIVRVYVGTRWYATYLETLLKCPELLSNSRKIHWIRCGVSLLVNGDGEMFRHILNFLRHGRLFLPSGFREWRLFCQEVNEFRIPSLVKALNECKVYRLWLEKRITPDCPQDVNPEGEYFAWCTGEPGNAARQCLKPTHMEGLTLPDVLLPQPLSADYNDAIIMCHHPSMHYRRECVCSMMMERSGLEDLGAILKVQHHHLVANDGSTASFQESILYSSEHDIPKPSGHAAAAEDIVFFSLNMSHEEIFYARSCHCFLTGVLLDSVQQGDPKSTIYKIARLMSKLWALEIPTSRFVDKLLTLEFYRGDKCTRETLQGWLEVTLPYARRFSQCMNMLLQRRGHSSVICSRLRTFLQVTP